MLDNGITQNLNEQKGYCMFVTDMFQRFINFEWTKLHEHDEVALVGTRGSQNIPEDMQLTHLILMMILSSLKRFIELCTDDEQKLSLIGMHSLDSLPVSCFVANRQRKQVQGVQHASVRSIVAVNVNTKIGNNTKSYVKR
jgi:hypothetical protein